MVIYPFIGYIPLESVGAALAIFGVMEGQLGFAWLGVGVLVIFSAVNTIVDWVLIITLAVSLVGCQLRRNTRRSPS